MVEELCRGVLADGQDIPQTRVIAKAVLLAAALAAMDREAWRGLALGYSSPEELLRRMRDIGGTAEATSDEQPPAPAGESHAASQPGIERPRRSHSQVVSVKKAQ